MTNLPNQRLTVTVTEIRDIADGIFGFKLQAADHGLLPAFDAGAHIDVHLTETLIRQYSLCNLPGQRDHYLIAVQHEAQGQGGSRFMHEQVKQGMQLEISLPRNQFSLAKTDMESVLISGGIGITPIWAMAQELEAQGKPWKAYLYARSPSRAPFFDEIIALGGEKVTVHYGDSTGKPLDIPELQHGGDKVRHFYCCGPASMLDAFEAATSHFDRQFVHLERFQPVAIDEDGTFDVVLAKSKRTISVACNESVLQALLNAGISMPSSCRQGYCGTCETGVLEGEVDHRDSILTDEERLSQSMMMPCVSRAKSGCLVLDL